jgi:omega-6 fatty acid desaturase (delta-12 desaturase)
MGKGGQRATRSSTRQEAAASTKASAQQQQQQQQHQQQQDGVWTSPYNPLDKSLPTLPTKGEIKAVIPKECFQRSYFWSMFYLVRGLAMAAAFAYATSQVLSTDIPTQAVNILPWAAAWGAYAFWMGTILTGPWVLAHECGHGAFSDSQTLNDCVGFVVHQALLVPYFAWQYSHAKHHRRTNHLVDGESHVPSTATDNGLGPNQERNSFYAAWHEAMGDGAFAVFQIWSHLAVGWPLYLLGLASTGKVAHDGTPLHETGQVMDHFRPTSPMFPVKLQAKILLSSVTEVATLAALGYAAYQFGTLPVILYYWGPYCFVNAWLVLYTWLQHTDPSVPHYGDGEWTWVKGAISTIDRPYGIFDFFHHTIGSTHVAHHLFHEMPWYNADKATAHIKAFLEPKGLYNYDPTPWWKAMWRIARTCHFMESNEGTQYFKSLEDVPLTKDRKKVA